MALTQISTQGIKDGTITGSDLATNVDLVDNQKLRLGNSQDLQIYYDPASGGSSFIDVTGSLQIHTSQLYINNEANTERLLRCTQNDSVELYFDGSKKFETTSDGATLTGSLTVTDDISLQDDLLMGDTDTIKLGDSADLQIQHDGTDSHIKNLSGETRIQCANIFKVTNYQNTETYIKGSLNGSVELYHDNSKKFETRSNGAFVTGSLGVDELYMGDNEQIKIGAEDDFLIYHGGSENVLDGVLHKIELRHGSEKHLVANPDGAVELYHDNSKKFETTSIGATVTGALHATTTNITTQMFMPDQGQIRLGDSDDLKLYHHGHSTIQNTNSVAALLISSFETHIVNAALTENIARFKQNAEVELYYDNSLKFTTTTNGVSLFGDLRFNNGTWTGESLTGKIQTHSGHMYLQLASTTGFWIFRLSNGTEPAYINSSGTYSGSDERRKKDITTITSAVDTIKKLTGRSFTWKEDNKKSFGVIAQEIEPVLPDLVTTQSVVEGEINNNPYKLVNYAALTGHFIEAIKELSAKIDVLETEVAALKAS